MTLILLALSGGKEAGTNSDGGSVRLLQPLCDGDSVWTCFKNVGDSTILIDEACVRLHFSTESGSV